MSWPEYVKQHLVGRNQVELAAAVGVSQTAVSRWISGKQGVDGFQAVAFARAVGDAPLAALVAAGFITEVEAKARPAAAPDYTKLSKRELLDLLSARMVDVTDELAERTTARYLADNGDDAAAALSAATRDMLDGILVATLHVAVKARLGEGPADRATERTGGNVTEMRKAFYASDGASKWEALVDRYLRQAQGQPAEAISLLAHDGAKGANVDEDEWMAAMADLSRQLADRGGGRSGQLAVAAGDEGDEDLARRAAEQARASRAEQQAAIDEMNRKKGPKKP